MSQNVTLWGASYSQVPSILVPKTGGGTAQFDDTTISSNAAAAADIASGKLAYVNGSLITGTNSGGGGGGTGVTLVCSKQITTSTTSTTAETVETWGTGHSEIWTGDKILYVKVRDDAGPRSGYFFGTDNFFTNVAAKSQGSTTSTTVSTRLILRVNSTGTSYTTSGYSTTTGYGLYVDTVNNNGGLRVRKRYHSSYSTTVNGTYTLSVYLIDVGTLLPSL